MRQFKNKLIVAMAKQSDPGFTGENNGHMGHALVGADAIESFAEAVVLECILTIQRAIVRDGDTPENLRSRQHVDDIVDRFDLKCLILDRDGA